MLISVNYAFGSFAASVNYAFGSFAASFAIITKFFLFARKEYNKKRIIKNNNMYLIVGLGNPGEKYKNTRHNIGFRILDEFRKENNFPSFTLSKKLNSLISEKELEGKKVLLAKPQTFMNNSGQAVKTLLIFYKIKRATLIVIHDDIDILLGKIKIIKNRGSAGHKGVESIIEELKTKNFTRMRVGIQPKEGKPKNPEKFVLQNFTNKEKKVIKEAFKKTSRALKIILLQSLEKAMAEFN